MGHWLYDSSWTTPQVLIHSLSATPSWVCEKTVLPSSLVVGKDHASSPCCWNMGGNDLYQSHTKAFERQYATILFSLLISSKQGQCMFKCGSTRRRQPRPLGYLVAKITCPINQILYAQKIKFYYVKPFRFQVLAVPSASTNLIWIIHSY